MSSKKSTTVYEGKEVETIDCTPTWEGMLNYYLLVLENGNEEGKKIAKEELRNMARMADVGVASIKEKQSNNKPPSDENNE